jgi:hypothetical protein
MGEKGARRDQIVASDSIRQETKVALLVAGNCIYANPKVNSTLRAREWSCNNSADAGHVRRLPDFCSMGGPQKSPPAEENVMKRADIRVAFPSQEGVDQREVDQRDFAVARAKARRRRAQARGPEAAKAAIAGTSKQPRSEIVSGVYPCRLRPRSRWNGHPDGAISLCNLAQTG